MKKCKIKFRFHFENGHMDTTHIGESITKDDAEAKAWQSMGNENFKLQVVLKTKNIEVKSIEFI